MSFDNNFLGQLINKLPSLDEEIVQILSAAKEPLSVADIYKQSKVAGTSRDISLLLTKRRDQLNIEISHYATRPGFRECAHYQMMKTNAKATEIQQEPVVAMPEIKLNEVTEMNTKVKAPQFKIVSASELDKPEVTTAPARRIDLSDKPKVLQMLEYIDSYPFCTMKEIQLFIKDPMLGDSYIKGYIKDGRVRITRNNIGKKLYTIAPGLKVSEFYGTKVIVKAPKVKAEKIKPEVKPEWVLPPVIDIDAIYKVKPAQSEAFRCAYTNDGCLLLLGIQVLPIELNAAQTNDLIDYISQTVTPIGVEI